MTAIAQPRQKVAWMLAAHEVNTRADPPQLVGKGQTPQDVTATDVAATINANRYGRRAVIAWTPLV